jgi:hypothetical protein
MSDSVQGDIPVMDFPYVNLAHIKGQEHVKRALEGGGGRRS